MTKKGQVCRKHNWLLGLCCHAFGDHGHEYLHASHQLFLKNVYVYLNVDVGLYKKQKEKKNLHIGISLCPNSVVTMETAGWAEESSHGPFRSCRHMNEWMGE